ncbi:hypothetical protein [Achromobacter sp. NFACC18-2]|uniref:hypothetical protein n=1 Tax=Achromobacter sp. NFACC18-2 TaxID=1564112 RepID=UPI0008B1F830|nr:hypothetical protein [Achromobacter sp. NFACC18-2]SEK00163.1 hypothetical protein SAMN03159494_04273 [Achromobacter sp. NFACC18-2]
MNDNGILEQVPGQYVGEALKTLPPAATAEDREYPVEIDAGHAGRVRIFFRKQKAKRGKFSHWFWVAKRAERVQVAKG